MKKLGIIISAYKADKFIMESINSLKNQKIPNFWDIEFFIGVDGCSKTHKILKKNKITHYLSNDNVGTYIIANSLIKIAKENNCDMFLRFDADDVACKDFLYKGIKSCEEIEYVRTSYYDADKKLKNINKSNLLDAIGIVFFTNHILDLAGGYKNYRIECDTDFMRRIAQKNYFGIIEVDKPIFLRRNHRKSLTNSFNTRINSKKRIQLRKKLSQEAKYKIKVDNPKTTNLQIYNFD